MPVIFTFFFFNDTATTEIYTLSLHDALPICLAFSRDGNWLAIGLAKPAGEPADTVDRKSTRLNSSHLVISYAVFCLKKKNPTPTPTCANPIDCPDFFVTQHYCHFHSRDSDDA